MRRKAPLRYQKPGHYFYQQNIPPAGWFPLNEPVPGGRTLVRSSSRPGHRFAVSREGSRGGRAAGGSSGLGELRARSRTVRDAGDGGF